MRIVLFWDYYGPYHFSRLAGAVVACRKMGHTVVGLELAGKSATYAWKRERPSSHIEFETLFPESVAERISSVRVYLAIRRYLLDNPSDVLFVPSYWPAYVFAATLAARSVRVKVVIMAESHYATGRNEGVMILIKRALVRLYASAMVGGSAQRSFFRYLGMPASHIFDGYDVVNNDYFAIQANEARKNERLWRQRLKLPRRYILSLGRFVAKKNLTTLLRAYEIASRHGKIEGVHLVFVGSGSQKAELLLLAHQLGLPAYDDTVESLDLDSSLNRPYAVHFYPFAQIEETPVYYGLADCFVLPSKSEEWGLVVNEAMASACPVIVSRQVGCSFDLIDPGVTGFRFHPENPDELAWYLESVCEKPGLRETMAAAARHHVFEWGPERFGRNVIAAAKATALPKDRSRAPEDEQGSVILLQTSFPDYRVPVYDGLSAALGPRFMLYTGMEYFTPDVRTCSEFRSWIVVVRNTFFLDRKFLWQGDALADVLAADVAILELNPRIISNWLILFTRLLWGRPTILWGHAWGRDGEKLIRNILRVLMMRAASAVITYTNSQRQQLLRVLPYMPIVAAPNSSVRRSEVVADTGSADALDTIIYVGRLNPAKKPALLLKAFIKSLPLLPENIRLCFVGTGGAQAELVEITEKANLQRRILFKGHVNDRNILRSMYARSFCSVSPGYVGLSAIQSFSFGVPMVIADHENHAPEIEACTEDRNTVFFRSDDADSLANALVRMWGERTIWNGRRQAIADWTAENYSTDTMVATFSEIVKKITVK